MKTENFSRRAWIKILGAVVGVISAPIKAKSYSHTIRFPNGASTFEELKEWISGLPNRQANGSPTNICSQTGDEYVEVFSRHAARPGDEKYAEKMVVEDMQRQICKLFTDRLHGTIYWRVPLETQIQKWSRVKEYREDGPDVDFLTDRRCVMDRNWKAVKAYCRLTVGIDNG